MHLLVPWYINLQDLLLNSFVFLLLVLQTLYYLVHLLLLLFLTTAREIFLDSSSARVKPDPLAFEFVESSAIPAEQPPDTRLVSDRNVRSADQSNADLPRSELAATNGLTYSLYLSSMVGIALAVRNSRFEF